MWLILMKYDAIQIKAYFIKHEVLKKYFTTIKTH